MIVFGMSTKLTFEFVENLNCQVFHLFYLGDTYLIIKTPCNSVYIIVYILGIHCTLSNKSCPPTEYIPDVFRKWQLCSLNYDRAIDHQPPCKPDSFLFLLFMVKKKTDSATFVEVLQPQNMKSGGKRWGFITF